MRDGSAGAGPSAGAEATVNGGELQLALVPPASGNEAEDDAEPGVFLRGHWQSSCRVEQVRKSVLGTLAIASIVD